MCVCVQDPAVVHWVNGVLLQSLDPILLPVYLDVLQVLKAKVCAVYTHRLEIAQEGSGARGGGTSHIHYIPCAYQCNCTCIIT